MHEDYRRRFFVDAGKKLVLRKRDPSYAGRRKLQESAPKVTAAHLKRLTELQYLLYADQKASILIVLQGMDAAGKDGTVDHVMSAFSPAVAAVTSFKEPTAVELAHDFLWRVHPHVPGKGSIAIFNRSHYEDVVIVRVHKQIDGATAKERYKIIAGFEEAMIERGTRIVKFFLHLSKEEQLARFARRLGDPARNWKISDSDYSEREFWDDYVKAFEDAIDATSTKHAPWYVIPSNHKWFRNLAVSQIVVDTMEKLNLSYPKPTVDLEEIRRKYHEASTAGGH
jgi:PPK2 family polyphosphate:nucleotide phosphotransferase